MALGRRNVKDYRNDSPPAAKGRALGSQDRKCSVPSFFGFFTFADGLRPWVVMGSMNAVFTGDSMLTIDSYRNNPGVSTDAKFHLTDGGVCKEVVVASLL